MSKRISALLRRLILALILLSLSQGLPSCRPENLPASSVTPPPVSGEEPGWSLLLVNAENPLPEDHPAPTFTELSSGLRVDSRAYPQLQRMMDAARAEGLQPVICSAYRPREKQQELFEKKIQYFLGQGCTRAEAETEAALLVARPGTSEHETGLALDIVDINYQLLDEHQQNTAVQRWLMAHCAEYGFILRYPPEKSSITGISYEPWHYRYVGVEAAREIAAKNLCLEEYLAQKAQ